MKCIKVILFSMIFTSLTTGCSTDPPTFEELTGTWKSEDGCEIILRLDSTCIVKNLNVGKFYATEKDTSWTFVGRWTFHDNNSPYQDIGLGRLDIKNLEVKSCAYWVTFYVSGQGLLENKPPWYLFEFIGGFDDYNKYILKRQE